MLVFGAFVGIGFAFSTPGAADGGVPPAVETVRVMPGESLTAIARRMAPGYDTAAMVAAIREYNDLGSAAVIPGQALVVPVGRR